LTIEDVTPNPIHVISYQPNQHQLLSAAFVFFSCDFNRSVEVEDSRNLGAGIP